MKKYIKKEIMAFVFLVIFSSVSNTAFGDGNEKELNPKAQKTADAMYSKLQNLLLNTDEITSFQDPNTTALVYFDEQTREPCRFTKNDLNGKASDLQEDYTLEENLENLSPCNNAQIADIKNNSELMASIENLNGEQLALAPYVIKAGIATSVGGAAGCILGTMDALDTREYAEGLTNISNLFVSIWGTTYSFSTALPFLSNSAIGLPALFVPWITYFTCEGGALL